MTTSELRTYIDRVLGNSIRCLLPSYWWKRLFGVTLDNIEGIDQDVSSIKDRVDGIDTKVGDIDTMVEGIASAITKQTNIASSTIPNLQPNTHYTITSVPSGDVVIESVVAPESVYGADYQVSFKYPASLTLPSNVIWEGGAEPELDPTKMHVLHIKARTFGTNMVYMASIESYAPTLLHPEYLTIEALEDFTRGFYALGGCDYMLDNSGVWINSNDALLPTLNAGQIITLRANANTGSDGYLGINFNGNEERFIVRGNALAIYPDYDIDNPEVAPTTSQLFVNSGVYAVEKGILPAKSNVRYTSFFSRCVHLVNAPELPATDVVSYSEMFYGCTSLKKAPELPALTVVETCYAGMFNGCTSLKSAPSILPALTLEQSCYREMFKGCTSLVNAPKLPATTLAPYCYSYMFMGCSSLVNAPSILPALTLEYKCYNNMFISCTNLKKAPQLPATTLAEDCYYEMFRWCTNLVNAPELPATTLAPNCYSMMFSYTNIVDAPELPATTLANGCYYNMFRECHSLIKAPELPAEILVNSCYKNMFYACTNLNYIKMLATDVSATECLFEWVLATSKEGTFVKNAAMTSLPTGSSGIPKNWTVEDAA